MFQRKKQNKTSKSKLDAAGTCNRADKGFKITIIKMLTKLWRRMNTARTSTRDGKSRTVSTRSQRTEE